MSTVAFKQTNLRIFEMRKIAKIHSAESHRPHTAFVTNHGSADGFISCRVREVKIFCEKAKYFLMICGTVLMDLLLHNRRVTIYCWSGNMIKC